MRNVERLERPASIGADTLSLIHRYPRDPMYRKSGSAVPQVGDVARCGHVKALPHNGPYPPANCVVCIDLTPRGLAP